jgi:hypothetical protein
MFNAPDSAAGKRAKCPTCSGVIQIPTKAVEEVVDALPEPASAFDDEDYAVEPAPAAVAVAEDRKHCPMCGEMIAAKAVKCRYCGEVLDASMRSFVQSAAGDVGDPGWRRVRSGLATMYYSFFIVIATAIVMLVALAAMGAMGAMQQPNADPPVAAIIVIVICVLVMLGAGIAILVGQILCASVPEHSGARGLAIGAAVCMVANILVGMVGGALQNPAISLFGNLISIIGYVLFILFIRRAAIYLNDHALASSAVRFIIFCVALFVGFIVFAMIAGLLQMEVVLAIVGLGMLVAALASFIWYLRLIKGLMTAIDIRSVRE